MKHTELSWDIHLSKFETWHTNVMSLSSGASPTCTEQDAERLKRDAEGEMRRKLPDDPLYDSDQELGRYRYDAVKTLMEGTSKGYLITCIIRRERSCLHEIRKKGLIGSDKGGLGIVKMSARGLVMLLESEEKKDASVVETVAKLYTDDKDQNEGIAFTHRIAPVLRTFLYEEDTVNACLERTGKEMAEFVMDKSSDVFASLWDKEVVKLAVMFHGRGIGSEKRLKHIHSVAKGFSDGYSPMGSTKIDLTQPDVVISVDMAIVMGRSFVFVGICHSSWCDTKPEIRLKSLVPAVSGKKSNTQSEQEKTKKRRLQ